MAFGKLHGVLASKPLALPGKNAINIGLAAGNAAAAATFLTTGDPTTAVAALGATTVLGGIQGAHMTASIGGMIYTSHLCFIFCPYICCILKQNSITSMTSNSDVADCSQLITVAC